VPSTSDGDATGPPHLKRVLGLWDLVYYGIILTSPIAVVPMFGEAQVLSHGHAVRTLLAAILAMTATAVSFGRMATVYPSAGSVYTYVSRGFNPHIGFVVGWAMFLEYLFQPLQNSLYAALTIQRFVPQVPFALLSAVAVGFMTGLCWFGIPTTARANQILLAFMSIVMLGFLGQALWYIFTHQRWHGLISTQPIYDPRTFSLRAIAVGTALAATTYIGFDGVSIWRRKSRTRGATFGWRRFWFVFSPGCTPRSRCISPSGFGRTRVRRETEHFSRHYCARVWAFFFAL
jgi:putrescine importer